MKFNDRNGNGVRDAGETGLPNWIIRLAGTDGLGNGVDLTVQTDAQGRYSFLAPPGTYTVSETPQSDWIQTAPVACSFCILDLRRRLDHLRRQARFLGH